MSIGNLKAFFLGMREFRSGCGMTYDGSGWSARSMAYDRGRELAHLLTFRRYEV